MGFKKGILSLIILLFVPGSVGENISVSCNPQTICALKESEVNLTCSYSNTNIRTVFWFNSNQKDKRKNKENPEDFILDSDCTERVTTKTTSSSSTLTIRDLREGDSGDYQLVIITDDGVKHRTSPAVRLTVTVLQVEENRERLTCSTLCSLTSGPHSYIWYKNGRQVFGIGGDKRYLTLSSRDAGSYSCSVSAPEEIRSNAVCVSNENCWNVIYTNRRVCVLEGSSVDFSCTYSYPSGLTVTEVFWHYMWYDNKPNDLKEDEQFAGRVEFIGDKERNCTLRIKDVRMNDSGEYYFRIITGSKGETFSGNPGVTLKVTGIRKDPEDSVVLKLITVGVVVLLVLLIISAALCVFCVIRRKREAEKDTHIQSPKPADDTYTALNLATISSDYDTLQTPNPAGTDDTYTALNPTTISSDYDTLQCVSGSSSDTYSNLNPSTLSSDYSNITGRLQQLH